ncbi:nucleotide-binding domain-containing protein [Paraphoma chrysanthemicola]|uniref:Nucleotide-binding domain-containing protein n=1 Tax=Paraphoma chrysanthemicola TaxID=798071 RepID=A0A8K0QUS0_9PLEO|nr:nucleotide-binding domain-containing protein [Paraphoma chrysanthemicola]
MSSSPSPKPVRPPSYPQLLNHTLTLAPAPLVPPTRSSPHILVLGAGVAGLSTAWTLLDHGYRVTILAADWASYTETQRLTSQIAGALWEYPPAVCGQHTDAESLERAKAWCMISYGVWSGIAAAAAAGKSIEKDGQDGDATDHGSKGIEEYGVKMRTANFFFKSPLHSTPSQLLKMHALATSGVHAFSHNGQSIIAENNIPPTVGVVDAYTLQAPVIETDVSMAHLLRLVVSKGAKLVTRRIIGHLIAQEDALRAEFNAEAIVNCTGLGSAEIAGDGERCFSLRGAVLRVINDGTQFEKIEEALCIPATTDGEDGDENGDEGFVFILPRNDNILLLGGFADHTSQLELTPESPVVQRMRARCEAFMPSLKNARLDPAYPLAQGLRPFRKGGVRVEREGGVREEGGNGGKGKSARSTIVHNYGHGGAGWSLSFGCAADVLRLVEEVVREVGGGSKL